MKKLTVIILMSISIIVPVLARQVEQDIPTTQSNVRFAPLHIYLDSGNKPLAAYQFELKADAAQIKIIGVEGGQHKAFEEAPYYDPTALANERVIIAAFNTGSE